MEQISRPNQLKENYNLHRMSLKLILLVMIALIPSFSFSQKIALYLLMLFSEILGQEYLKNHLVKSALSGRIPHAQLFVGPEGSGTLAMAIA